MRLEILGDMMRSFFRKPDTVPYSFTKRTTPDRLRGCLSFHPEACIGCLLCVEDCPSNAIELVTLDKVNQRFVLRYYLDRCIFCAQCVQTCNSRCLEMSNTQWELAAPDRNAFTITYGRAEDLSRLPGTPA